MKKEAAQQEIDSIKKQIKKYEKLYFNNAETEESDYQYDCLFNRLKELENLFPELKTADSPTQYVKDNLTSGFVKYEHTTPMLSLQKTYSFDELSDFIDQIEKKFGRVSFCCEPKFDGMSINLHYENGKLQSISTRGNGYMGDNITQNKNLILNCPDIIDEKNTIDVRGEALMSFENFEKNSETWSNPRNATAGLLRSLYNVDNKKLISLCLYDLSPHNFTSRAEMLETLKKNFYVNRYQLCFTKDKVFDFIKNFEQERKTFPFPTDGVVIKLNELKFYDELGTTNKFPRWAIAFKYKPDSISTQLRSISYQVGRTGVITPIANFDPILLSGSTVKCASLYNSQEIKRLNLCEDDFVLVEKSGEIIPKIIGVDITRRKLEAKPLNFITHCPSCKEKLIFKNDICYCLNKYCPEKILSTITHFVSKKAMNINSLGAKTIKLLVGHKLIKNFADIYSLNIEQIVALPGFDILSASKLIEGIEKSKKNSFEKVLFAIGIGGVGEVISKNIVQHCKNINKLINISVDELVTIPLVGYEVAMSIKNFFSQKENLSLIEILKDAGLKFEVEEKENISQDLSGQKFVITGTFSIEREEIKEKILARGGEVLENVSKQIDFILVGDNPGPSKIKKAQMLNIKTVYELQEFDLI